jgi:hypothetical protein
MMLISPWERLGCRLLHALPGQGELAGLLGMRWPATVGDPGTALEGNGSPVLVALGLHFVLHFCHHWTVLLHKRNKRSWPFGYMSILFSLT